MLLLVVVGDTLGVDVDSDVVRYRAVRDIKAGEVLWTNYGKGFWKSGKRMTNIVLITDQPT